MKFILMVAVKIAIIYLIVNSVKEKLIKSSLRLLALLIHEFNISNSEYNIYILIL